MGVHIWSSEVILSYVSLQQQQQCRPGVKVKKITYTINGQECDGDCGTHGEKYWWCTKPQRWPPKSGKGGDNGDSTWDYCSPDYRTRYNKPCKDACEGRGEDFFWCNTIDRDHTIPYNWDYCSPKAMEPVIARGGRPCVGICDTMGKSYKWCNVWNAGYSSNSWDYCGEGTEVFTDRLFIISSHRNVDMDVDVDVDVERNKFLVLLLNADVSIF